MGVKVAIEVVLLLQKSERHGSGLLWFIVNAILARRVTPCLNFYLRWNVIRNFCGSLAVFCSPVWSFSQRRGLGTAGGVASEALDEPPSRCSKHIVVRTLLT